MSITVPEYLPTLSAGKHDPGSGKACVMEYVSVLAGERFSDHPRCTIEAIASVARGINDAIYDEKRQLLIDLIPRLLTANVSDTERRGVEQALEKWIQDSPPPWTSAVTMKAAGFWGCGCGACQIAIATQPMNTAIRVLGTSTPDQQVEYLSLILDEFDRLAGRDKPVVSVVTPERMTRAVCKVEGRPMITAPSVVAKTADKVWNQMVLKPAVKASGWFSVFDEKPVTDYNSTITYEVEAVQPVKALL